MSNRAYVLPLLWLTALPCQLAVGEPLRGTGDVAPSEDSDLADRIAARDDMSAQEAIRIALEAVDGLDTADDEARTALLQKINRSIEAVERSSPHNSWLYYLQGRVYAVTGRGLDAANLLQRFVETRAGRNEWKAHRVLGDLFVGRYPRLARASYEAAARLKRNDPTVLIGLSQCAFALGDIDEAVRFAREAAHTGQPEHIRYGQHFAVMLMAKQRWADAQRVAEKGLAVVQAAAPERRNTQVSLEALDGQYKLLITILERHALATPAAVEVYLDLAGYLRRQADNEAMLARLNVLGVLQAGVDNTAPDTPVKLLQQYAIALAEGGRQEEAVAQFEAILGRDVGNTIATEWLARLRQNDAP